MRSRRLRRWLKRGSLVWAMLAAGPAAAETHALVVAGLGGDPSYEAAFRRQAEAAAAGLATLSGNVSVLSGEAAARERLQAELRSLGAAAGAGDTAVVLLIGHGTYDERDYRFNLPGPDATGAELAAWLDELPAARQLVVVATSASGALIPLLQAPNRTVITATRSGGERNATVFHRPFAAALADQDADTDKDGHVSATEAFAYAEAAVAAHYRDQQRMVTEHPQMAGPRPVLQLARLPGHVAPGRASRAAADRLNALESELAALRAEKDILAPDRYYAELQRLMLEIAVLRRQGGPGAGEPSP